MNDIGYNIQLEKLCNVLQLGNMVSVPKAITGGFLHRMYGIQTTEGKYAIKVLNPKIMLRPMAMQNFINSERIANIALNNIPALSAKSFNGNFMQEIENQFYLVFDWVDGINLKPQGININHCKKIGAILADIHMTDFSEIGILNDWSNNEELINWNYYLKKGQEKNMVWVNELHEIIDKLHNWNVQANKSISLLSSDMIISHRDLDPKNVMWTQDNPIVIDWESAGYTDPMRELTETAIYWSESELGSIDKEKFMAFIEGYEKRYGTLQADWETVLINGFSDKLDWLEYNLKRSLWIECTDVEEQRMGATQVTGTIITIRRYADMIPELEKWLSNEI